MSTPAPAAQRGPLPLPRRGSSLALRVWTVLAAAAAGLAVHAMWVQPQARERLDEARALVGALGLTDLSLLTEARYTRHLGLADLHSAFQDGPGAPEHFPAGSLVRPPRNQPPAGFVPAPR